MTSAPPTMTDLSRCYRLFLDREVEDGSVAVMQLTQAATLWDLIERFAGCTEAIRRRINRSCGLIFDMYEPALVRLEATPAQRTMLMERTLERWERCGRGSAYEYLFRDPRLFDDRSQLWNCTRRFEFGAEEIDRLCTVARRNGVDLGPCRSVIAFGSDVAFRAQAAARQFGRCVGVEIGVAQLEQGKAALAERVTADVELILPREFLLSNATCDLFYSTLTLQHAPPPVIAELLDACLKRINQGGYAFFQLPSYIYDYRYETGDYLAQPDSSNDGEIHALPQAHVFSLLARHGLVPIEVTPDQTLGPMGFSHIWFARKEAR